MWSYVIVLIISNCLWFIKHLLWRNFELVCGSVINCLSPWKKHETIMFSSINSSINCSIEQFSSIKIQWKLDLLINRLQEYSELCLIYSTDPLPPPRGFFPCSGITRFSCGPDTTFRLPPSHQFCPRTDCAVKHSNMC